MDEIKKFISGFTKTDIGNIKKIGRRYFLAEKTLEKTSEKINSEIFSIGIFLGEKKKEFRPTPALIDIIAKHSHKKIFITKKAEWLFLCDRDVFSDNIIKENEKKAGKVLVQNEKNENLGYGELIYGKRKYIKNLLDKGNYLRREN